MSRFRTRIGVAAAALLALTATSCASDKAGGGDAKTGPDGVKYGPGVTDDKITVGMITDLTGPYAALGKSISQGAQLHFEQLNAAGGICGRTVEPLVRDMGYDVQKSVAAYTELESKVAALPTCKRAWPPTPSWSRRSRRCRTSSGRPRSARCGSGWTPAAR